MKKIFYFIASAIVALGAVACQNDIDDNIDNNQQTEGLSFTATIDDITRVSVDESDKPGYAKKLSWEGTETIVVTYYNEDTEESEKFNFTNTEATPNIFTCTETGVNNLVGKTVSLHHGDCSSATFYDAHAEGPANSMYLTSVNNIENFATEEMGEIKMCVGQQLFRLKCYEEVTLKMYTEWSELGSIFFYDWENDGDPKEEVVFAAGEHYFSATAAYDVTIEAYINGVKVKETSGKDLYDTSVIFNLGTIEAEDVVETTTVYLEPDWWTSDGANIYAYYWGANGDGNVKMTDEDADGIYECELPNTTTGLLFARLNPAYDSFGWNDDTITDRVWNQTGDLTMPEGDKNHYYIQYECWEVADYVPTTKTTTIYFWPDSEWAQANATFAAQFGDEKLNFTVDTAITDYQVYSLTYTGDAASFSILRMSPDGQTQWNKKTGLTLPTDDKNCFFSTGWDESGASAGYWAALPEVTTSTITITAYNHSDWTSDIYVYAFGTPTAHTAWPGVKLNTVSGNKMTATITVKHFADEQIKFVVNCDGKDSQKTADSAGFDVAQNITLYFTNTQILNEAPAEQSNTKLYLIPSGSWKQNNERYAAYFFGDGDGWASMTDSDKDGTYEVSIPAQKNYTHVIFCRMNGSTTDNNWDNKWDQTGDLSLPYQGNNVYSISSWSWIRKK